MLQKLLDLGIKKGFFSIKKIGELKESCCKKAEIEVIDFDETKNVLHQKPKEGIEKEIKKVLDYIDEKINIADPTEKDKLKKKILQSKSFMLKPLKKAEYKSCDGLKIMVKHNRFDFIELKGWQGFKQKKINKGTPINQQITQQIRNWQLKTKLLDSYTVLREIFLRCSFSKQEEEAFYQANQYYVIVVDTPPLPSLKLFALALEFLSQRDIDEKDKQIIVDGQINQIMEEELENINHTTLTQRPILLHCKNIDEYYKKLN